jgi:hypothetical protein
MFQPFDDTCEDFQIQRYYFGHSEPNLDIATQLDQLNHEIMTHKALGTKPTKRSKQKNKPFVARQSQLYLDSY